MTGEYGRLTGEHGGSPLRRDGGVRLAGADPCEESVEVLSQGSTPVAARVVAAGADPCEESVEVLS